MMKRILSGVCIILILSALLSIIFSNNMLASGTSDNSANIYSLRIDNITKTGADIYWSTAVPTIGTVYYGDTDLPELFNPQTPGSQASILVTVVPGLQVSEPHYTLSHHVTLNRLDMNVDPFIQYTISSQPVTGAPYTLSGQLVLVNSAAIPWWQNWQYNVFMPIATFIFGLAIWPAILSKIWKKLKSKAATG
jgi:hypothetical protein